MLSQHSKKHHHTDAANVVPDPLVDPGNPSHRHQARSTAHLDRPCSRLVALAAGSPGRCSSRPSQKENATVMLGCQPDHALIGLIRPAMVARSRPLGAWVREIRIDLARRRAARSRRKALGQRVVIAVDIAKASVDVQANRKIRTVGLCVRRCCDAKNDQAENTHQHVLLAVAYLHHALAASTARCPHGSCQFTFAVLEEASVRALPRRRQRIG